MSRGIPGFELDVLPGEPTAPAAPTKGKAADPAIHPTVGWIVASYVLVAVGAIVGIILWNVLDPGGFKPQPDISAFGVLFIFAAAIERVLEPLTKFSEAVGLDKEDAVKERDQAVEDVHTAASGAGMMRKRERRRSGGSSRSSRRSKRTSIRSERTLPYSSGRLRPLSLWLCVERSESCSFRQLGLMRRSGSTSL